MESYIKNMKASYGDIYNEREYESEKPSNNQSPKKTVKTPILDSFGRDLTHLAEMKKLDPIVGREEEIERITQILGRRKKNNPVLIGEAGTGKTAIVEGLANRIVEGNVPLTLQGKKIYTIEMTTLVAGTKYRGQFEERMKALVDELIANPNIIIFLDEIHTMVGAGGGSGSLDAANIFKPALARGEIQCVGATTFDEYRKHIESDAALDRRFQKVVVEPPTAEETIQIISNIKTKYEEHHNVLYSNNVIEKSVYLSERYITDRQLPDKAIDIIDEVGSRVHLKKINLPPEIKELEDSLKNEKRKKNEAVNKQQYEKAATARDAVKKIEEEISYSKKRWLEDAKANKIEITEDHVFEIVSMMTGIPVSKMSSEENKRLLNMSDYLKSHVIGQNHAVEKIVTTIQRNRIGLGKHNKPIGSFIFMGTTGVGKTELAKSISRYLFHSEDSLIRIDMSEFMEKHSSSKMIGAPPGYVGYDSGGGGLLTEKVRRKPYSVVLFDEIEKAHPDIFNIMLQVLDEGFLTDNHGRKVSFKNCLIIMTSNLGAREAQEAKSLGFGFKTQEVKEEEKTSMMEKSLSKFFAPEFLNRLDEVIYFNNLDKENMLKILEIHEKDLQKKVEEIGYKIQLSDSAKEFLVEKGTDSRYGARLLSRTIQKYVEDRVSEIILKESPAPGKIFKVDRKDDELIFLVRSR
jgi:ATP-dependent Clp protease ATP-binding subunit ClpC